MLINWTCLLICVSLVICVDGTRGRRRTRGHISFRRSNPPIVRPKSESIPEPELDNTTTNNGVGIGEQDFEDQKKMSWPEIGTENKSTNPAVLPAVIGILIIISAIIIIVCIVRRKRLNNSSRTGTVKKSEVEKQISEDDTRVLKHPSAPPENIYVMSPGCDNTDVTINQYCTLGYDVTTSVESGILVERDTPDTETEMFDNPDYCPDIEAKMNDNPGYCPDTETEMFDNPDYCPDTETKIYDNPGYSSVENQE